MAAGQGLDMLTLADDIIEAQELAAMANNVQAARVAYATALAQAIDVYVKSGKVVTVGSATTQTGSVI